MATFMLFEHHMASQEEQTEGDVPAEAADVLKNLFGQMGEA
jgi:hypothetical protein